ncbi:MAG: sigma-54-dependent Fis family transcriptional regulator [Polyangiaceae bacterium]|nr:sigma-54-dependent Fis family transcriptional regulator [Polyangiaceae bacterium]
MNLGADDYVTKPFSRAEILDAVRTRLERRDVLAARTAPVGDAPADRLWVPDRLEKIVVSDPAMLALYDEAAKAAVAPISVLLLGETGVGKEVLAQNIHEISLRKNHPFLALNCAALSESLLESELFGNERGAFTGAIAARPGLFEAAQGGTVFLDEVGELPMVIQVKLLRVLEERRVIRVGGRAPIDVDVRFVAATNRDLEAQIAHGTFREDLYYRLAGITLTIPPLRDRTSEIVPLALRFAKMTAAKLGRRAPPTLAEAAREALLRYGWPGNLRELRNVLDRAVVLSGEHEIEAAHLPAKVTGASTRESSPQLAGPRAPLQSATDLPPASGVMTRDATNDVPPSSTLRSEMESLERKRIVEALERCGGNQTAAAEMLGMSRRTLVTRLGSYELPRPRKRT